LACDQAVKVASDFARSDTKTLVVVAPDHGTGGPAYIGQRDTGQGSRVKEENEAGEGPGIGREELATPVNTQGFPDYVDLNQDGFPDNEPEHPMAIGWASNPFFTNDTTAVGEHIADDVPVFAYGPGSEPVHGYLDNTDVNRIMIKALGLKEGPRGSSESLHPHYQQGGRP